MGLGPTAIRYVREKTNQMRLKIGNKSTNMLVNINSKSVKQEKSYSIEQWLLRAVTLVD